MAGRSEEHSHTPRSHAALTSPRPGPEDEHCRTPRRRAAITTPLPTPPWALANLRALEKRLADVTDQLDNAKRELTALQSERREGQRQQQAAETPTHLKCPITLHRMHSPVVVTDGHTFERRAIEQWLRRRSTNPLTGAALISTALHPSMALRDATRAWEEAHGRSPVPRPPILHRPPSEDSSEDSEDVSGGEDNSEDNSDHSFPESDDDGEASSAGEGSFEDNAWRSS